MAASTDSGEITSGYPDSHLSRQLGATRSTRATRILLGLIPIAVLAVWLGYLWLVSGVLPSTEKYPNGKLKAEGYVKRTHLGEYVRHGHWTTFHENGAKSGEGSYDLGQKLSDWTYWDQSGQTAVLPSDADATIP